MKPITHESNINSEIDYLWRWKDQLEVFHIPSEMTTSHLFYTLRMIWNHTMPENIKLTPYKKYKFGPYYTDRYIKEAITRIGAELFTRTDINKNFMNELQFMKQIFSKKALLKGIKK